MGRLPARGGISAGEELARQGDAAPLLRNRVGKLEGLRKGAAGLPARGMGSLEGERNKSHGALSARSSRKPRTKSVSFVTKTQGCLHHDADLVGKSIQTHL